MFDGRFKGKQPENFTDDDWQDSTNGLSRRQTSDRLNVASESDSERFIQSRDPSLESGPNQNSRLEQPRFQHRKTLSLAAFFAVPVLRSGRWQVLECEILKVGRDRTAAGGESPLTLRTIRLRTPLMFV